MWNSLFRVFFLLIISNMQGPSVVYNILVESSNGECPNCFMLALCSHAVFSTHTHTPKKKTIAGGQWWPTVGNGYCLHLLFLGISEASGWPLAHTGLDGSVSSSSQAVLRADWRDLVVYVWPNPCYKLLRWPWPRHYLLPNLAQRVCDRILKKGGTIYDILTFLVEEWDENVILIISSYFTILEWQFLNPRAVLSWIRNG